MANNFNTYKKPYYPGLDACRFLAALIVIIYHTSIHFPLKKVFAEHSWFVKLITLNEQGGHVGVTFFFVLSGFIITHLLFIEKKQLGKISLKKFYVRRILRIWPVYFLTLLIGYFIYPEVIQSLGGHVDRQMSLWRYLGFLGNFDIFLNGYPYRVLGVQWSVCIEEQFYLIWPLLLIIVKKNWQFIVITSLLLIISVWYMQGSLFETESVWNQSEYRPFHSLSALLYLVFGGGLAFFYKNKFILKLKNWKFWMFLPVYFFFFLYIYFYEEIWHFFQLPANMIVHNLILGCCFVFFICEQIYGQKSLLYFSKYKWICSLGKYSYSMYLWHMFAVMTVYIILAKNKSISQWSFIWMVFGSLGITMILSFISYHYIEKPFLRFKKKYQNLL